MLNKNFASTSAMIARANSPKIESLPQADMNKAILGAIDSYYSITGEERKRDEEDRKKGLEEALGEAIASGDEAAINKAYAQLNPAGYVDYLNRIKANREASDLDFARKKELLDIQNQNAMGLARLKDALGGTLTNAARNYEYLKQQGLSDNEAMAIAFGGNTEAVGGALASGNLGSKGIGAYDAAKGKALAEQEANRAEIESATNISLNNINDLEAQIRKDPSVFGIQSIYKVPISRVGALTGNESAQDYLINRGNAYRQLGNIKNDLIAKAKAAGQSGINTAREIEQATAGLSENSSPEEILGALGAMRKSAQGLINIQKNKSSLDISNPKIRAAKAAGYTDEEIQEYLRGRNG